MLDLSIYLKADRANLAKHINLGTLFRNKYYIISSSSSKSKKD